MDRILLEKVKFMARVGVTATERSKKQLVILDIAASKSLKNVGSDLRKTLDYASMRTECEKALQSSEFILLEEIAEKVAKKVKEMGASSVVVRVHKPHALKRNSAKASVEIER